MNQYFNKENEIIDEELAAMMWKDDKSNVDPIEEVLDMEFYGTPAEDILQNLYYNRQLRRLTLNTEFLELDEFKQIFVILSNLEEINMSGLFYKAMGLFGILSEAFDWIVSSSVHIVRLEKSTEKLFSSHVDKLIQAGIIVEFI